MFVEGCPINIISEKGNASVECIDTHEPNVIQMIFRSVAGDKVTVRIDVTPAVVRAQQGQVEFYKVRDELKRGPKK